MQIVFLRFHTRAHLCADSIKTEMFAEVSASVLYSSRMMSL